MTETGSASDPLPNEMDAASSFLWTLVFAFLGFGVAASFLMLLYLMWMAIRRRSMLPFRSRITRIPLHNRDHLQHIFITLSHIEHVQVRLLNGMNELVGKSVSDGGQDVNGTCAVCLDELQGTVRQIRKCKHAFHSYCIDTWLRQYEYVFILTMVLIHAIVAGVLYANSSHWVLPGAPMKKTIQRRWWCLINAQWGGDYALTSVFSVVCQHKDHLGCVGWQNSTQSTTTWNFRHCPENRIDLLLSST